MTLYDTNREDICNTLPDEITDLIPPYLENMTFDQKFQMTYISLKRTIRLKSRLLSLTNAYYLGKLLNSLITSQQYDYNRLLTPHYQVMARAPNRSGQVIKFLILFQVRSRLDLTCLTCLT